MGSPETDIQESAATTGSQWLARAGLAVLLVAFAIAAYLWLSRERLAGDAIDDYLDQSGLQASYDIVSIGAQQQVIANVVVGDPAAPDLTIDRVTVGLSLGLGTAGVGSAVVERPRLYGSYRDAALSFGALDPFLFGETDSETSGLPAIDVTVVDGGARLETDFGVVGAFLEGEGALDDGFAGKLAVLMPEAGVEGCKAQRITAYGDLTTSRGVPGFDGPLRLRGVACKGFEMANADIRARLSTEADFAKLDGAFEIGTGALSFADAQAEGLLGRVTLSLGNGSLVLDHDATIEILQTPFAELASLRADGAVRSARGFSETSWNAQIEGEDVTIAGATNTAFDDAIEASEGTLAAPLLAKLERGLAGAARAANLRGDVTARLEGDAFSLVVPEARLRAVSGETVLALSRLSWSRVDAASETRLTGNILTGGADMPRITGRIDQSDNGPLTARLSVAPYQAGADRLSIPNLIVRGLRGGGYAFNGVLNASGAIPGGLVEELQVPLIGSISASGALRAGMECTDLRFEALKTYDLSLDARALSICPWEDEPMVSYDTELALDIFTEELSLAGNLGGSPLNLSADLARLTYPGGFQIGAVAANLGEADSELRFQSDIIYGDFDGPLSGVFAGASAELEAVPLDLSEMDGVWTYVDDDLRISNTRFTVTDRPSEEPLPRFNPVSSQGAALVLSDGSIAVRADLQHKSSGVALAKMAIGHKLESGEGAAVLQVEGLTFGAGLSMPDLTPLALGLVADTTGTVTGEGVISWDEDDVTSTGAFRTDDLDLAAAFGPVTGLKGEVRFSDLLNLTTEPDQVIEIGSINPGIEALDGKVRFAMTEGTIIDVADARWPFMGGELVMRPTRLRYGTGGEQNYTFDVTALDAATFVTQMELSNIGATGSFDGTLGITFDADGNGRIDQGQLISRAPGGNVSYIGELTYEDMGAISNYAFQSLRSLDYRQMSVGLEGDLTGEIITRFTFEGVSQGEDANRDFITRRLAKLPIRFKINVRSENFYELATMVRTFWDPDAVPDAFDTGLLSASEVRSGRTSPTPDPTPQEPKTNPSENDALRPRTPEFDESSVQLPESENSP
ncbi:MAG: YdbH domain-containing protein [Erythrobacter sp.]|nr:YdbH domain-containing protein [Erythrobacter sp.]